MSFDVLLKNKVDDIPDSKFRAVQEEIEHKHLIDRKNLINSEELIKLVTDIIFNSYFNSHYNLIPKNVTKKFIKNYFHGLIREERKAEILRLLKKMENAEDTNKKLERM